MSTDPSTGATPAVSSYDEPEPPRSKSNAPNAFVPRSGQCTSRNMETGSLLSWASYRGKTRVLIGVTPGHEVDADDDSDDEDEGEGNDTAVRKTRLVMYDALVRARDVRVLTARAEAEAAARREEEEWRSSHSVSSGDEEVEEPAEEEGFIVKGRDDTVEEKADSVDAKGAEGADTAVHETLTSSTEDAELAEFERLEREVLAEVGAG